MLSSPLVSIRERPENIEVLSEKISRLGLGVFFGMVGCLPYLELLMVIPGLLKWLMLLLLDWRRRSDRMLVLDRGLLVGFFLLVTRGSWLLNQTPGLTAVSWLTRFLELEWLRVVNMLMPRGQHGLVGLGDIGTYSLPCLKVEGKLAGFIVLCLNLCRRCSGLRFGESWLLCTVVIGCMCELTILMSLIMFPILWLVGGLDGPSL